MTKNKEIKKELNENIRNYKLEMINETTLIIFYSLDAYLSSLINFGIDSSVTKDCLAVIREVTNINSFEKKILKFIKNNYKTIDLSVAIDLIDQMSERKEEEILYYYKVLDDIEDACDMQEEFRAKRIKKDFTSISNDEDFLANVYASKYTIDDIMRYLAFDADMVNFIKTRIVEHLYDFSDEEIFDVVYDTNDFGIVTDIKLVLPTILDYKTLMINVNLLIKAWYLYISYNSKVPIDLEETDVKTSEEEKRFDTEFKRKILAN